MGGRYQQIKDWQGLTFKTYKQLIQLNIKKLHLPKNGQKTLLNIINHQRKVNQNYNEISPRFAGGGGTVEEQWDA